MGRKRKYATATAFRTAVNAYFRSISRSVPMKYRQVTGYTNKGKPMYEAETILNDRGKPIMRTAYARPPSVAGLCLHLGMSREALREYGEREEYDEVVQFARLRIEEYLTEELMERDRPDGAKFNLSHNFGWSEKQTVEAAVSTEPVMVQLGGKADEWAD